MLTTILVVLLTILGCSLLVKGTGGAIIGLILILAGGLISIFAPRKKTCCKQHNPWNDI